ncbi:sugar nucleotide-binding protein [Kineosporia rhizophila]|uniref:SDR family oxidoreductase n=1 Tax=Kineosporia TaxID=49184 RepID=UPI001E524C85|nr:MULTISPECIES: sugar nucleotide-binding protein [Kineosporia]MCE0539692.1 sugar nucleotide-binding protein [Kineosporia rhizophila]GLY16414.1 dTDP-4-dehydrorhamnose reductase [Kineosporia sp. NBRC 101677]
MRLLVIGGSGYLGGELMKQAGVAEGEVHGTYLSARPAGEGRWHRLDVTDRAEVAALLDRLRPDMVVNTAYKQSDWATTAEGAMHVAAATASIGGRLVQVSSDALFSGKAVVYDESARPDPVHAYGAAKAAAEVAVAGLLPGAVIARTSLIVGNGDSPTEKLVHALASGATSGVLFADDVRCAVHVADLAGALLELARANGPGGVCHLAGADAVSRHELGLLIARRDGLDETALPVGSRAASGVAGPLDVRLDSTRTQARLATRLRGAREFLARG